MGLLVQGIVGHEGGSADGVAEAYYATKVSTLEGREQPGLTSTEWLKACGCAKSTFHGYRRQLVDDGMVINNDKLYCPTAKGREAIAGD